MDTTNMTPEIREAWGILAEINDLLSGISLWVGNEADVIIKELHDKWQKLCSKTKTARSKEFLDQCRRLLAECESFRVEIVEKSQSAVENTKDKASQIVELTGGCKETKALMEEILKCWNEIEQPRLVLLYEKTAELESSIMEMMEFAVQPIEAATEPPE